MYPMVTVLIGAFVQRMPKNAIFLPLFVGDGSKLEFSPVQNWTVLIS
jgi:hypothetical protein